MPEWLDDNNNIIDELDPEVWFVISAFFNNCTLPDSDVHDRLEYSQIMLLRAAAQLCEELGLYYKN